MDSLTVPIAMRRVSANCRPIASCCARSLNPGYLHFYISRKKEERDEYSIIYISHGSYVWCQLLCEKPHIRRRY